MSESITFEIMPQLKGKITERDLITSYGTLSFWMNSNQFGSVRGIVFRVTSPDYVFELGLTDTDFYFKRNEYQVIYPFNVVNTNERVHLFAFWRPDRLSLLIYDGKVEKEGQDKYLKIIDTLPIIPPNALLEWVRHKSIILTKQYESDSDFYKEVVSALQSVQDKVTTTDMLDAFWDISYEGKKIVSRKPKHETNIQKIIHGLLFDLSISKNFLISPESPLGSGNLDFLISGNLRDGTTVHVCVEFKNAHSTDLENGIIKQLPLYMKSKGSDLGVYVILDFRGEHFDLPKEDEIGMDIKLISSMQIAGIKNIRLIILELGKKKSPSKI